MHYQPAFVLTQGVKNLNPSIAVAGNFIKTQYVFFIDPVQITQNIHELFVGPDAQHHNQFLLIA